MLHTSENNFSTCLLQNYLLNGVFYSFMQIVSSEYRINTLNMFGRSINLRWGCLNIRENIQLTIKRNILSDQIKNHYDIRTNYSNTTENGNCRVDRSRSKQTILLTSNILYVLLDLFGVLVFLSLLN